MPNMDYFHGTAPRSVNGLVQTRVTAQIRTMLTRRIAEDLGLARRVGQLKSGADVSERLARSGWATALALAEDAGDATRRRFVSVAEATGLELWTIPLSSEQVGARLGTPARSIAALGRGRLATRLDTALHRVRDSL